MKPRLGFVGLGNIGEPTCRQLLAAGYGIPIHVADPAAGAKLEGPAAEPAKNLQDLISEADVVLLSLPNSEVVEESYSAKAGSWKAYRPARSS